MNTHARALALSLAVVASARPATAGIPAGEQPAASATPRATLGELLQHTDMHLDERVRSRLDAVVERPLIEALEADDDGITLHGDLIVLQGDAQTVSEFGNGNYGLVFDEAVQNPISISRRVMDRFGDVFDFITVWTAFRDRGADGLAYYVGVRNDTEGIGGRNFDQGALWGSNNGGRLQGFVNMKDIDVYGGDIDNPNNFVYPVIGQEITHRWLAEIRFRRPDGTISSDMLGRDGSHWSSLLQAEASVQDGNEWLDHGDGTFEVVESNARFSPLDLYGMGLLAPSEVPDWYLIEDATFQGNPITGLFTLPIGIKVSGTRTDITIADVIAAEGERRPDLNTSQKEFRVAYVLVMAPGQSAEDVASQIRKIQTFIVQWNTLFEQWTGGRARLCPRATADCAHATLQLSDWQLRQVAGDGDGVAEPGETFAIDLSVTNPGGEVALAPRAHLVVDGHDVSVSQTPVAFDDVGPGETLTIDSAFEITLGADVPCGQTLSLRLELATGEVLVPADLRFDVGLLELYAADFERADPQWVLNAAATDTAAAGLFEQAQPEEVRLFGSRVSQPGGGADGSAGAFITGAAAGGNRDSFDLDAGSTSVTSPLIDLQGAADPVLSYYTWRVALNPQGGPGNRNDKNDPFVVELSADDGLTWQVIERDTSIEWRWVEKRWRLIDVLGAVPPTLRIRFTAIDADPQSITEAGFDEVRIEDLQPTCFGEPWAPTVEAPEPPDETPPQAETPEAIAADTNDAGCGASQALQPPSALALLLLCFALRLLRRTQGHVAQEALDLGVAGPLIHRHETQLVEAPLSGEAQVVRGDGLVAGLVRDPRPDPTRRLP